MEGQAAASVTMVAMLVAVVGFMVVVLSLIAVIPYWKICTKAGFNGALSLLMLVPVANFILPFYIAFADWPALKNKGPNPQ